MASKPKLQKNNIEDIKKDPGLDKSPERIKESIEVSSQKDKTLEKVNIVCNQTKNIDQLDLYAIQEIFNEEGGFKKIIQLYQNNQIDKEFIYALFPLSLINLKQTARPKDIDIDALSDTLKKIDHFSDILAVEEVFPETLFYLIAFLKLKDFLELYKAGEIPESYLKNLFKRSALVFTDTNLPSLEELGSIRHCMPDQIFSTIVAAYPVYEILEFLQTNHLNWLPDNFIAVFNTDLNSVARFLKKHEHTLNNNYFDFTSYNKLLEYYTPNESNEDSIIETQIQPLLNQLIDADIVEPTYKDLKEFVNYLDQFGLFDLAPVAALFIMLNNHMIQAFLREENEIKEDLETVFGKDIINALAYPQSIGIYRSAHKQMSMELLKLKEELFIAAVSNTPHSKLATPLGFDIFITVKKTLPIDPKEMH